MRDSARLSSKQTETVWFSSAKRKPPSCEVLLQLQWAAESNLIKCSCKSNMMKEKKDNPEKKVWKNKSSRTGLFFWYYLFFCTSGRACLFLWNISSVLGARITFWSKSKQGENGSDACRSPDMTLSNVNMAKTGYVNMPESKRSFIQKCLFSRNIFLTSPSPFFLAQISTKNTHRSLNNSNVYVLVLLL